MLNLEHSDKSTPPPNENGDAIVVADADGHITFLNAAAQKLTGWTEQDAKRKKLSEVALPNESRYRRLFEAVHDGILIVDALTGRVIDVNPFLAHLLGYSAKHLLGKPLWEIGIFQDAETWATALATIRKAGFLHYPDHPLRLKDGTIVPTELVSSLYRQGDQDVIQYSIRDVTERNQLLQQLAKAKEDAEAASRSKSEFLANMSHEIRTPMSAILGFTEMLQHKSQEECKHMGCIEIIQRNASQLLQLINEILDLSKVEAGQMTVQPIACDLPGLLAEVISLMRPRAVEKGLRFEARFDGSIPASIRTDPARLRQILVNLLANAVKFTEVGGIEMRVREEGAGSNITLRVDVVDTGIGMAQQELDRLFRPFTQGDESISGRFGGTGLGLTISRELGRLLGGDVTVTSKEGTGSTFTVRINGGPRAGVQCLESLTEAILPRKQPKQQTAEIYLRGRILLVEDGIDSQRLLRMQLSGAGASVVLATNGQIAVDLATSQPFNLILMDMQMPVMDGYAATAELRRRGNKVPIIALTAHAMSDDREKCLASGCNWYLSKPVEEDLLLRTASHYLGNDVEPVPIKSPNAAVNAAGLEPLQSSLAHDPRMMEIIPGFIGRLPAKVRQMEGLLSSNDLPGLQRMAHDLAGTAGGYGFGPVTAPARRLQQAIKTGNSAESISADMKGLLDVLRSIEGFESAKVLSDLEEMAK